MNVHKVYLVGAGPGKSDLITVRGLNILKQADVVIYDYLVDRMLLDYTKEGAELICCERIDKPRDSKGILEAHQRIGQLIVKKSKQGKRVVRLKNGTPTIFGRCSQELEALLKNKIDFEIVPGITAANAASCYTGIPLTDRRFASSCVFVTGREDPNKDETLIEWEKIAKNGTIVLYMAVGSLNTIIEDLLKAGKKKNTPISIITNVSLPTQTMLTGRLENILEKVNIEKISPPAIIIIGEVVKLEKEFNWLRRNKKVLFTGLSKRRFFIDGTYFHLPLIKIKPMEDYREFDNYLKQIRKFDWLVFTSRYGVKYFFERLNQINLDSRFLSGIKIAGIGNSTACKLKQYGIVPDLVPPQESSKGLISEFKKIFSRTTNPGSRTTRIFLPRSDLSDKGLSKELEKLGAEVTTSFAYRNVIREDLPDLNLEFFDEIMFTSPSTVRNFKKRYGSVPNGIKITCIGDVTSVEVDRQGLRVR